MSKSKRLPSLTSALRALILLIVSTGLLTACSTVPTGNKAAAVDSLYDKVMESGKIRCGYVLDPPGCFKDPNTQKLSGIGIEVIELVGRNLGLKVEWSEEVDWGSMIAGLESGRYDIIATPIWPNASRARVADFTRPLYFSPVFAYVKFGGKLTQLKDIKELNAPKYIIASVDGATPEVIAREDFPNAKLLSLPQQCEISQLVLNVSSGKADATFVEPAVVAAYAKSNPGVIARFPGDTPVRVFPDCWAIRRGQMKFKSMINNSLDELINGGVLDKVIRKYEPAPNTLLRVSLPYKSSAAPESRLQASL